MSHEIICPSCQRRFVPSKTYLQFAGITLYPEIRVVAIGATQTRLVRRRDAQVLEFLMRHPREWVTVDQIADFCGMEVDPVTNVKSYIWTLRRVIGDTARIDNERGGFYGIFEREDKPLDLSVGVPVQPFCQLANEAGVRKSPPRDHPR